MKSQSACKIKKKKMEKCFLATAQAITQPFYATTRPAMKSRGKDIERNFTAKKNANHGEKKSINACISSNKLTVLFCVVVGISVIVCVLYSVKEFLSARK